MIVVKVKWSEKDKINTEALERFFSDFQERHITKYEIDLLGNDVKKDEVNSDRFYNLIENDLVVLVSISIIHVDLPDHIFENDMAEIYPSLCMIDEEIEVEVIRGENNEI